MKGSISGPRVHIEIWVYIDLHCAIEVYKPIDITMYITRKKI